MKNFQVREYVAAGLGNLNYKGMNPKSGLKVYRICKELDRVAAAVDAEQTDLIKKTLGDRLEAYAKRQEWLVKNENLRRAEKPEEGEPEGLMTAEDYAACTDEFTPIVLEMLNADADCKLVPLTFEEYMEVAALNENIELFKNPKTGECLRLSDMATTKLFEGVLWADAEE